MTFNFEFLLTFSVIIIGFLVVSDLIILKCFKKRGIFYSSFFNKYIHPPIHYIQSFFPILLIVLLLRSFVAEPFRIPSGSLEPTLLIGDFILVNKFKYGLRLPVIGTEILKGQSIHRGDIVVFRYPYDKNINFVKRVIGLPGDHINYINKILYINGQKMDQKNLPHSSVFLDDPRKLKEENLMGVEHEIFLRPDVSEDDIYEVIIPEGQYFMMGDNRDESNDSRSWGYVPEENILGKAMWVWLSLDIDHYKARWNRIGTKII